MKSSLNFSNIDTLSKINYHINLVHTLINVSNLRNQNIQNKVAVLGIWCHAYS